MIPPAVQAQRQQICRKCPLWHGQCTRGHILTSPAACPLGKFMAANSSENAPSATPGCASKNCNEAKDIQPLAYAQALTAFRQAMVMWVAAKTPLVSTSTYSQRISVCSKCPQYQWFQCKLCKCVVFVKARMGTTKCPAGKWPG